MLDSFNALMVKAPMPLLKPILFILLMSLASPAAFALEGFFGPQQLPERLANVRAAFGAAVLLESRSSAHSTAERCSGVFVSDQGHVLTALHCLIPAMPRWLKTTHTSAHSRWITISNQNPTGTHLPLVSAGPGLSNPLIIALGRGVPLVFPGYDRFLGLNADDSELESIRTSAEDFAIIKFDTTPQTAACVEIAQHPRTSTGMIYSIGFPAQTHRQDLIANAPGEIAVYSQGSPLRSFSRTAWAHTETIARSALQRLQQGLLPPGYFLNDLDGNEGSSGSMILNAAGELVGIATATNSNSQHYYRGLSYGLKISTIQSTVDDLMGTENSLDIFHCENGNH